MRIGIIPAANNLTPCGNAGSGEYEDYGIYITEDRTPPIISLIGGDTVVSEIGLTYKDKGAIAIDNIDGVVPYYISGNVNTSTPGYYRIKFDAKDKAGNYALPVYRVVYIHGDNTPPVITILSSNPFYHKQYKTFIDPGAVAYDSAEGVVNVITTLNTVIDSIVGSYVVKYKATDSKGNSDSATRIVYVTSIIDTVPPQIKLIGSDTIYIEVKSVYTELGVMISDSIDSNPQLIIKGGPINTSQIGTTILTYIATDFSGNKDSTLRCIIVRKTTKPVINIVGNDTISLMTAQTYTDQGVTFTDAFYTDAELRVNLTSGSNFPNPSNSPGTFKTWFHVVDPSGNASDTTIRTIEVKLNGMSLPNPSQKIEVYPNPSSGILYISGLPIGKNVIEVLDMNGKIVYSQSTIESNVEMNTTHLAAGIYIIRTTNNNQTNMVRFDIIK